MKNFRTVLILVVLFSLQILAQQFKFAWLTDTHVGASNALDMLSKSVHDINSKDFNFVILSGDITEAGFSKDLQDTKNVLDSLKIKYHIIPGNHDVKWSETCGQLFKKLWGDDKFNFTYGGVRFIGFSTGILLRSHGGHASPENLLWLEQTLKSVGKDEPVVIVTHHMLDDELDNWFDVTNILKGYNVIAMLCGHGHVNKNSILSGVPSLMARTNLMGKGNQGYCSVTANSDSLLFFEQNPGLGEKKLYSVQRGKRNNITTVDSVQFINYKANVLNNINLKKTLTFGLFVNDKYISTASIDGTVFCFDIHGKELWNYKAGASIIARPAVVNDILVAGTITGELLSIDCKTGKLIKQININEMVSSQITPYMIKADNKETGVVLFGTAAGKYFCFNASDLRQVWMNSDAKGVIECEPLIIDGKIIYGSWDTYLYCCNISDGKNIWRWQGNDKFYYATAACKPVTDGENVFVAAPDRYVSSVNLATGKTNWRTNEPKCWESLGYSTERKCVIVKGFDKNIYFVEPATGKVINRVPIDNDIEVMASEVIDVKGNALFTTRKGYVYAVDKDYNLNPIMFLGTTKGHSVKALSNNTFAVSNLDGRIVIFTLENK